MHGGSVVAVVSGGSLVPGSVVVDVGGSTVLVEVVVPMVGSSVVVPGSMVPLDEVPVFGSMVIVGPDELGLVSVAVPCIGSPQAARPKVEARQAKAMRSAR